LILPGEEEKEIKLVLDYIILRCELINSVIAEAPPLA
jgi:hypothetical protein